MADQLLKQRQDQYHKVKDFYQQEGKGQVEENERQLKLKRDIVQQVKQSEQTGRTRLEIHWLNKVNQSQQNYAMKLQAKLGQAQKNERSISYLETQENMLLQKIKETQDT